MACTVALGLICCLALIAVPSSTATEGMASETDQSCLLQAVNSVQGTIVANADAGAVDKLLHQTLETSRIEATANKSAVLDYLSSVSIVRHIQNEIEFELSGSNGTALHRNKVVLILLQVFMLPAWCGIDRCYMGQPCLGLLKGLSLSGLGIWGLIDWFVILVNSMQKSTTVNSLGFRAHFDAEQIEPAFYISCVQLGLVMGSCCCWLCMIAGYGAAASWNSKQQLQKQQQRPSTTFALAAPPPSSS